MSEFIHKLKHFLPSQAPLKDFIHHNLLHFFQDLPFHQANQKATKIFGYKTYLSHSEYQALYHQGQIKDYVLEWIIAKYHGNYAVEEWKTKVLKTHQEISYEGKIERLVRLWKEHYHVNIAKYVLPKLFRIISNYLDQGIGIVEFPYAGGGLLDNLRIMEQKSLFSNFFLKKGRVRTWLLKKENLSIESLLEILIGDAALYEEYLFNISFKHPGWSGMVSVLEEHPEYLIKPRKVSLEEFIILELLLQIDYLDYKLKKWEPLSSVISLPLEPWDELNHLKDEPFECLVILQEALEWSYYVEVLSAIIQKSNQQESLTRPSFQSIHCIDDREESFRRYLEHFAPDAQTYSMAGFFQIIAYYQHEQSDYFLKIAPAPSQPKHLIREKHLETPKTNDIHLETNKQSYGQNWFLSHTLGFWSAVELAFHLIKPHNRPITISCEQHHSKFSTILYEYSGYEGDIQYGFKIEEAYQICENFLREIGLIKNFAPFVYVIAHGAGSTNNPYFAAYDCGACSGKPGSVNAIIICRFFNHPNVRNYLKTQNIVIPDETVFIPALHNTTTDEITFYDTENLNAAQQQLFEQQKHLFYQALEQNATERARRFETLNKQNKSAAEIHRFVRRRQYALFETRPEYNHATNAVCIIGRRELTRDIFLDRRAFLQSYDYTYDTNGSILTRILKSVTPVCAGINLEYYYSRVDNERLGAGTKLPQNVFGLIGVSNGSEGDLRIGLPSQMVEIHDPLRLLMIIEQKPDIVLEILKTNADLMEWYANEWLHLVVLEPGTKRIAHFRQNAFHELSSLHLQPTPSRTLQSLLELFLQNNNNLNVYFLEKQI